MDYLGTRFIFKSSSKLPYDFDLCVTESREDTENEDANEPDEDTNDHVLTITVSGENIHETLDRVPLDLSNPKTHVYRSKDLRFTADLYYDRYRIESFRVLLKFRNNRLSPVSTLYVTCTCGTDENPRQTQRLYALTLEEIEAHCVSVTV